MIRDALFSKIRHDLKLLLNKREALKEEFICLSELNAASVLVRVASEGMFLLDRIMLIAKRKTASQYSKGGYSKFPVCYSLDEFNNRITRSGLDNLQKEFPELLEIILGVQPFHCGRSWLSDQHQIAELRHSERDSVYIKKRGMTFTLGNVPKGSTVTIKKPIGNGDVEVYTVKEWGVTHLPPAKIPKNPTPVIEGEDNALQFIEKCIIGTNDLSLSMIDCFEKILNK